ncbi:MAG: hypothetical protein NTZ05_21590 [Chloroflexi bacterium]|nr:hypothetical protein [Chloroflexota bacterium]
MERDTLGLPKLELPPEPPITVEELARRKKVGDEIRKLRENIGPIDLTLEELMGGEDDEDNG